MEQFSKELAEKYKEILLELSEVHTDLENYQQAVDMYQANELPRIEALSARLTAIENELH